MKNISLIYINITVYFEKMYVTAKELYSSCVALPSYVQNA